MIDKLTPEQEALIPVYREKWRAIALSTEPIDREKAADAVKAAYALLDVKPPEFIFSSSPYEPLNAILNDEESELKYQRRVEFYELNTELYKQQGKLQNCINWRNFLKKFNHALGSGFSRQLVDELPRQLGTPLFGSNYYYSIEPDSWARECSYYDFCISILNFKYEDEKWSVVQSLVKNCGWIFPYDKICYVCDRPRILCFDSQERLHAEGSAAIQFADGFSVYAYHGVRLPEQYGKVHPQQWRSEWLLSEDNAEVRRVLIQGIGYNRICQELAAVELDIWQEYTLLKIDNNVDVEAIYLLKMTCPSTGHIHVLRVPPDVESAREAIRWVNWGIDPEEFVVQT
ncbi:MULTISPECIES: DUF6745 domain-containing protein [Kamptonema]|uniref:DUF6745 domain-containing protein n=1 Tax=Kamptonema TaxID=1501433 RepID=UPI0001DAD070|nr:MULTISPECIES: hypothetical protein [Kamptonema]CBN57009.1 conserved hypothetical protein [Kamptonema sp. PCC 6506]